MNIPLYTFMLVLAITVSFGNSIVLAASPSSIEQINIITYHPGSISSFFAKIFKLASKIISNSKTLKTKASSSVNNFITDKFREYGYITTIYGNGQRECTKVKIEGEIFNHRDTTNWCGDNYTNKKTIVTLLQKALHKYGCNKADNIDGLWGTNTRNAVINYQRSENLSVDGIAGRRTWERIVKWN